MASLFVRLGGRVHVPLTATKAFTYGGRALKPGDVFTASRQDARALKAIRRAVDAQTPEAALAPPPPPPIGTLHAPVLATPVTEVVVDEMPAAPPAETVEAVSTPDAPAESAPVETPEPTARRRRTRQTRARQGDATYQTREIVAEDPTR